MQLRIVLARYGVVAALSALLIVVVASPSSAQAPAASATSILEDLGFSLSGSPLVDKNAISFTKQGLVVPTPWGDFEATIVSTPVDRMVRVPLSPNTEPSQQRIQPYITAGARKNVDSDDVLEQARAASFANDANRTGNLKAGAGVIFKLDDNVELFGEYQFMRLGRDEGRGPAIGPLGTSLDASGFSMGFSVRY